jgi:hypothetical protein
LSVAKFFEHQSFPVLQRMTLHHAAYELKIVDAANTAGLRETCKLSGIQLEFQSTRLAHLPAVACSPEHLD